jgi:hypothetical protein
MTILSTMPASKEMHTVRIFDECFVRLLELSGVVNSLSLSLYLAAIVAKGNAPRRRFVHAIII